MKNRSEKKKLDGNSFLLAVTIILFFVMYIAGIIMFGGRGFAKVQNFLNLFISNAGLGTAEERSERGKPDIKKAADHQHAEHGS